MNQQRMLFPYFNELSYISLAHFIFTVNNEYTHRTAELIKQLFNLSVFLARGFHL